MKNKLIDRVNSQINDIKKADALIRAHEVLVNNQVVAMPNIMVLDSDIVEIITHKKYVSRGAFKLEHAIKNWKIDFENKVVLDIGSSTGGFTQVALMNNAKKVYCVDVGTNQLDYKLRVDERTKVFENTNVKNVDNELINEEIDIVVCDVSFISLREVFKCINRINFNEIQLIALIKPQFEAFRDQVEKGGIVNKKYHQEIIQKVLNYEENTMEFIDVIPSPITGKKSGNIEYLSYFKKEKTNGK